jgi:hypothetical protein
LKVFEDISTTMVDIQCAAKCSKDPAVIAELNLDIKKAKAALAETQEELDNQLLFFAFNRLPKNFTLWYYEEQVVVVGHIQNTGAHALEYADGTRVEVVLPHEAVGFESISNDPEQDVPKPAMKKRKMSLLRGSPLAAKAPKKIKPSLAVDCLAHSRGDRSVESAAPVPGTVIPPALVTRAVPATYASVLTSPSSLESSFTGSSLGQTPMLPCGALPAEGAVPVRATPLVAAEAVPFHGSQPQAPEGMLSAEVSGGSRAPLTLASLQLVSEAAIGAPARKDGLAMDVTPVKRARALENVLASAAPAPASTSGVALAEGEARPVARLEVAAGGVDALSGGTSAGPAAVEGVMPALDEPEVLWHLQDRPRAEIVERALEHTALVKAGAAARAAADRAAQAVEALKDAEEAVVALARASTGLAECGRELRAARRLRDVDRIAELEGALRAHAAEAAAAEPRIARTAGGRAPALLAAAAGGVDSARRELGRLAAGAARDLAAARRELRAAEGPGLAAPPVPRCPV